MFSLKKKKTATKTLLKIRYLIVAAACGFDIKMLSKWCVLTPDERPETFNLIKIIK